MKFQLNVLESTGIGDNHRYEKVDQSPILETEDKVGLDEFLKKLNDYLDLVQMDLEILDSIDTKQVRTEKNE